MREAPAIQNFAYDLLQKAPIEAEIHELVNQAVYDKNCAGQTICILTFLPNIYDSNANERNDFLKRIKSVATKNRKHPFAFFWLQAGDQLDLERTLNLGFGFPAVVAISPQKSKIAIMKGSFDDASYSGFLSDLISGRVGLDDLKAKPVFKKADNWDGQDAPKIDEGTTDEL